MRVYEELLQRTFPLVLLVNAANRSLTPRRFPPGNGFAAFPDSISAQWSLDDSGENKAAFTFGGISVPDLFRSARDAKMAVALCFYETRQVPKTVFIPLPDVQALADGRLP